MTKVRYSLVAVLFLIVVGSVNAQWGTPYAIDRFQRFTGLTVKPKGSFVICRGASDDPYECMPTAGTQPWVKVKNIPLLPLSNNLNNLEGGTLDDKVRDLVTNYYMGAGFGNGSFDKACMPRDTTSREVFVDYLRDAPIRSTSLAQLVEESVVREARIAFSGLVRGRNLQNRGKIEAAFESKLRETIKGNASNKADVKWVAVYLGADFQRLSSLPTTKQCIDFARERDGSLVTGIAGFVIMSSAGSSDYVTESSFKMAASTALEGSGGTGVPAGIEEAVATAAASWSRETNRKISTSIQSKSPEPTFYPLWVSFAKVH